MKRRWAELISYLKAAASSPSSFKNSRCALTLAVIKVSIKADCLWLWSQRKRCLHLIRECELFHASLDSLLCVSVGTLSLCTSDFDVILKLSRILRLGFREYRRLGNHDGGWQFLFHRQRAIFTRLIARYCPQATKSRVIGLHRWPHTLMTPLPTSTFMGLNP